MIGRLLAGLFGSRSDLDVSVQEAARLMASGHRLLDVRQPSEYAVVRVPGSRLAPLPRLSREAARLSRAHPWLVICASGHRSPAAVRLLAEQGFEVRNVRGGIGAWHRAGLALERGR